jgi:hypothetical protein
MMQRQRLPIRMRKDAEYRAEQRGIRLRVNGPADPRGERLGCFQL